MDLSELKRQNLRDTLGITEAIFPRILTFVDFANVNHWFDDEAYDLAGASLQEGHSVEINIVNLKRFLDCFSTDVRFYYGHDPANAGSMAFTRAAKHVFGSHRVFTKRIQQIRHDLTAGDSITNTRLVHSDDKGDFVWIPKCNFDVEISVDAMRLTNAYDTLCLLSGDADFAALVQHLKAKEWKKIVLIKGGRIDGSLGKLLDLKIDASQIKSHIAQIKQKPGHEGRAFADRQPESTGRTESDSVGPI